MSKPELRHRAVSSTDSQGDEVTNLAGEVAGKQEQPSRPDKKSPFVNRQELLLVGYTIFCLAVTLGCTYVILRAGRLMHFKFPKNKLWTAEELAIYDGRNRYKPLLLAILGHVFDVSNGLQHYSKGKSYNHFCGRDATRAFISGNFSGDGLTDDIAGLPKDALLGLEGWLQFYQKDYVPAGKLIGRYFDRNGQPTKSFRRFQRQLKVAREEQAREKEEEERHPNCNSFWSSEEGGKVWCDKGFPRQVSRKLAVDGNPVAFVAGTAQEKVRCACYEEAELGLQGLQVYKGCGPLSVECKTSAPKT